jgi:hypothetical protein
MYLVGRLDCHVSSPLEHWGRKIRVESEVGPVGLVHQEGHVVTVADVRNGADVTAKRSVHKRQRTRRGANSQGNRRQKSAADQSREGEGEQGGRYIEEETSRAGARLDSCDRCTLRFRRRGRLHRFLRISTRKQSKQAFRVHNTLLATLQ